MNEQDENINIPIIKAKEKRLNPEKLVFIKSAQNL